MQNVRYHLAIQFKTPLCPRDKVDMFHNFCVVLLAILELLIGLLEMLFLIVLIV